MSRFLALGYNKGELRAIRKIHYGKTVFYAVEQVATQMVGNSQTRTSGSRM